LSHQDTAAANVQPTDGDILIYRGTGLYPNKFNITGSNNLSIGSKTSDGGGIANIMVGVGSGSIFNPLDGTITNVVTGTDNVLVGPATGAIAISGSYNVAVGANAGTNLTALTSCFGYRAGSEATGAIPSGANNIYINASGDYLHTTNTSRCFIKPIAPDSSNDPPVATFPLIYAPSTGELFYELP